MKTILLSLMLLFAAPQAFAQLIDGTYRQSCYLDDEDFITSEWQISAGDWRHTQVAHEDGACKSPWITYEETYKLAFLKFDKLNLLNVGARYMPHSQEVADVLNSVQFCNISNWKAKTWHNVAGGQCQDFTPPKPQQMTYSIISVSDAGFQIGQPKDGAEGLSEATRHQELSPLFFELQ